MNEGNIPRINLKGQLLTVGEGGINASYSKFRPYIISGEITALGKELVINSGTFGSGKLNADGNVEMLSSSIESVIRDNDTHKIGLRITGKRAKGEYGMVNIGGHQSNTFTGDLVVEGKRNFVYLSKQDGATAIAGNVLLKNGGQLKLVASNQIKDSSTITISGSASGIFFSYVNTDLSEKVASLIVERGQGIVVFGANPKLPKLDVKRTIILDELIIADNASLRIARWEEGRDHFLVRKDSEHLADAMKKISIDGWGKDQVYLKDYDKEYWSIEAVPEPAVCGAILGAVGGGVVMWRRRARRGP